MKEVTMPSGAILKISLAPFADGKALYQAIAAELKGTVMNPEGGKVNMIKDFFCTFLASEKIEAAILKCAARAKYNGQSISTETWEPVEAREDYIEAMYEIAQANVDPFVKSLYAKFSQALEQGTNSSLA